MIITIDGYAGAGKSVAARRLAQAVGFHRLNTGAMYRAAAFVLRRMGIDIDAEPRDTTAITRTVEGFTFDMTDTAVILNGEDLTRFVGTEAMGRDASRVGTFPEVRRKLKAEQRRIADGQDIICEGRDQGTAVFPDAPVKFFITADTETRARRRARQDGIDLHADRSALTAIVRQIEARDRQDETRAVDPLRMAPDAIRIDTSTLTPDEVLAIMLEVVDRCRSTR